MDSDSKLRERLKQIQREYERKQRKLKKYNRVAKAKEHVKKKLREQASLCDSDNSNQFEYVKNFTKTETAKTALSEVKGYSHKALPSDESQTNHTRGELETVVHYFTDTHEAAPSKKNHPNEQAQQSFIQNENPRVDLKVVQEISNSPHITDELKSSCETASGDDNICSQDIFSSPKIPPRNIFEDIQKTVVNEKPNIRKGNDAVVCLRQLSDDSLGEMRSKKVASEKENTQPAPHYTEKESLNSLCCGDCHKIQKSSGPCIHFELSKTEKDRNNVDCISGQRNEKGESKYKASLQYHFAENTKRVIEPDKKFAESYPKKIHSIALVQKSSVSKNNSDVGTIRKFIETNSSGSLKEIPAETASTNNKIIARNKNKMDCAEIEIVLETTTDSDLTVPCSSEEIINVKSRRRKRKSFTTTKERQSLRIAELSSQETLSQSTIESSSSDFEFPCDIPVQKLKQTRKSLFISSIFQCLVDEGKREKSNTEFSLPSDFIKKLYLDKLSPENLNIQSGCVEKTSCNSSNMSGIDSRNSEIMKDTSKLTNQNVLNIVESPVLKLTSSPEITDKTEVTESVGQKSCENMLPVNVCHSKEGICELVSNTDLSQTKTTCSDKHSCFSVQTDTVENKTDKINHCALTARSPADICSKDIKLPRPKDLQNHSMSPSLFDSQTDSTGTQDSFHSPKKFSRETEIGSRASPVGTDVLPEEDFQDGYEGTVLEQRATFQIPKHDQLISVVTGEVMKKMFIVCLCSINLRFYQLQAEQWSCFHAEKLDCVVKKNSGCSITWIPERSKICVLLQQRKTDCVKLVQYTCDDTGLDKVHIDSLWSRSVLVCPVKEGEFIASHLSNEKTHLTKFTVNRNIDKNRPYFDPICDQLTSLNKVKDIEEAVIGLSNTGQLYIWNYHQLSLLATIGVADVCPTDSVCSCAFSEQGFLFLPVFSRRRCKQAGSILVVNPQMGTSETLAALEAKNNKWTGCSGSVMLQDEYILVRENSGTVLIWDVYTGDLITAFKEASVSCVSSTANSVIIGHKQCIHVYENVKKDSLTQVQIM